MRLGSGSTRSCALRRRRVFPAGSSDASPSSRPPHRSRRPFRESAPWRIRPPAGGDSVADPLLRVGGAVRVAGVAAPGSDDLQRRDRARVALALDRGDRRSRPTRGSLRPRNARRLLPGARVVGRLGGDRLRGGEASARPGHDGDGLSRLRARSAGRSALVRAGRGRRRDDRAGARVLADPRRGAAGVSARDPGALVDRPRVRRPDVGARRPRACSRARRRC